MKPENHFSKTLESLASRPVRDLALSQDRFLQRLREAREVQSSPAVFHRPDHMYRPSDSRGLPGGLAVPDPQQPTLILPDLHTRRRAFFQILSLPWRDSGETVLQSLEGGRLNLVCVGDALHSEGPGALGRWRTAWVEFVGGLRPSPEMDREMNAGLALLEMIFLLQTRFPRHFFFLKGNHENITCEEGRGNHPFGKYAAEGEMVLGYLEHRLGLDMVKELYHWEHSLPLMVQGPWFLVSHAEPRRAFSPEEVVDAARRPEVVEGLTWTRRWETEDFAVRDTLGRFISPWLASGALYWAGHTALAEPVWYREENLVLFHGSGPLTGWILPPEPPDFSVLPEAPVPGRKADSTKKRRVGDDTADLPGPAGPGQLKKLFQAVSAEEGSGS